MGPPPLPWEAVPGLDSLSTERLPNIRPKPPLASREVISSYPFQMVPIILFSFHHHRLHFPPLFFISARDVSFSSSLLAKLLASSRSFKFHPFLFPAFAGTACGSDALDKVASGGFNSDPQAQLLSQASATIAESGRGPWPHFPPEPSICREVNISGSLYSSV